MRRRLLVRQTDCNVSIIVLELAAKSRTRIGRVLCGKRKAELRHRKTALRASPELNAHGRQLPRRIRIVGAEIDRRDRRIGPIRQPRRRYRSTAGQVQVSRPRLADQQDLVRGGGSQGLPEHRGSARGGRSRGAGYSGRWARRGHWRVHRRRRAQRRRLCGWPCRGGRRRSADAGRAGRSLPEE